MRQDGSLASDYSPSHECNRRRGTLVLTARGEAKSVTGIRDASLVGDPGEVRKGLRKRNDLSYNKVKQTRSVQCEIAKSAQYTTP